jgi:hypothetical protein
MVLGAELPVTTGAPIAAELVAGFFSVSGCVPVVLAWSISKFRVRNFVVTIPAGRHSTGGHWPGTLPLSNLVSNRSFPTAAGIMSCTKSPAKRVAGLSSHQLKFTLELHQKVKLQHLVKAITSNRVLLG